LILNDNHTDGVEGDEKLSFKNERQLRLSIWAIQPPVIAYARERRKTSASKTGEESMGLAQTTPVGDYSIEKLKFGKLRRVCRRCLPQPEGIKRVALHLVQSGKPM